MSRLGRDLYRRKLQRLLSHSVDEPMISLISAVIAVQAGNSKALSAVRGLPSTALGAKLGSEHHIPPWSLETLVNELLVTPKRKKSGNGRVRILDAERFQALRMLYSILIDLENAEDGIFLATHDVFYEMARIAQRQFPWQRGVANAPHLYRTILLYGSGSARDYFEASAGIALPDFIKLGAYLSAVLRRNAYVDRTADLSSIAITQEMREAALAKLAIPHQEARLLATRMRNGGGHTAYRPSILRDFPIIGFGDNCERLRAPIPELIMYRYTSGLYLDVVHGGRAVWTDIGRRFEGYVLEYLRAMMEPYRVDGEEEYGRKKARYRTPDVLISDQKRVVAVVECKAKRMSFEARYADDPLAEAVIGFDELAKGIFQIWRFFSHVRRGSAGGLNVAPDCQGIIVTADSWLAMARIQAAEVIKAAHALADREGDITPEDRREIAFCQIDDVEFALQNGNADSFLAASREIASGEKKDFMLSVAHPSDLGIHREYPFKGRIKDLLPWMADLPNEVGSISPSAVVHET